MVLVVVFIVRCFCVLSSLFHSIFNALPAKCMRTRENPRIGEHFSTNKAGYFFLDLMPFRFYLIRSSRTSRHLIYAGDKNYDLKNTTLTLVRHLDISSTVARLGIDDIPSNYVQVQHARHNLTTRQRLFITCTCSFHSRLIKYLSMINILIIRSGLLCA